MRLAVGNKLGPYEILAPIGVGGMGEVWKARDTRLDRIVAIKQINESHSARFEQEARAITALNHRRDLRVREIRRHARPRYGTRRGRRSVTAHCAWADPDRRGAPDCEADRRGPRSGGHHPPRPQARE